MATANRMEDVLTDRIVELDDAVVVPPPPDTVNGPTHSSGVFTAGGEFVRESITFREAGQMNFEPDFPDAQDIQPLAGRYMYGGVLFGHFGHFLMDSLARMWALDDLRDKIDGVLFTPKNNRGNLQRVAKGQQRIAQALGIRMAFKNTGQPLRVEKLFVPSQGLGLVEWSVGSPRFRRFVRDLSQGAPPSGGGRKLYLSRSDLTQQRGSYLSEKILETHLEEEGYTIVHPQQHPIEEQVDLYRGAEFIISPDGSPLHLLAYVGNSNHKVAVNARRSAETNLVFERQLRAFQDCRVVTLNCLIEDWVPDHLPRPGRSSWGQIDMTGLYHALRATGFISGRTPWPEVPEQALAEELAAIEEIEGQKFIRYERKACGGQAAGEGIAAQAV